MPDHLVAGRLRRSSQEILTRWEAEIREKIPAARNKSTLALRDDVPKIIGKICKRLEGVDAGENLEESRAHGSQRAGQEGYGLDQLISEYWILGKVIIRTLENDGANPIDRRSYNLIQEILFEGICEAADAFMKENAELYEEREMRERFVSMLTHDLRGPLTAIKSSAQLLKKGVSSDEKRNWLLKQVMESVDMADNMVRNLLDANRIRAGQPLPLEIDVCDLTAVAKQALSAKRVIHGDRFELEAPAELIGYWNEDGLRRAMENLLDNAVKYGGRDRPVKLILEDGNESIAIAVHNYGGELTEDELGGLFQQFQRARSAEKTSKLGWGLGLVLVKGIAEAHGGEVEVNSSLGKGTEFRIQLPRDSRKYRATAAA